MTSVARMAAMITPPSSSIPVKEEVLPGPGLLAPGNSSVYDEKIVTKLRQEHTDHDICAQRIFLEAACLESQKSLIVDILRMPTISRMKFIQAFQSLAAHIPEGNVTKWPTYGNSDELRLAATRGRPAGAVELVRYTLLPQLLRFAPGKSGRRVYFNFIKKDGRDGWMRVAYGDPTKLNDVPLAAMEWALDEYAFFDLTAQKEFFDVLREDGHEFICCFTSPILDFFAALFSAAYTGSWDGNLKRMKFVARPRVSSMAYTCDSSVYELLNPDRSPFKLVLQSMNLHYQSIEVNEGPKDQLAWLIQNIPEVVRSSQANFVELFRRLSQDWLKYKDSVQLLEAGILSHLLALQPNGKNGVLGFGPKTFSQGLQAISEARSYRGKLDGEGVAAFLNEPAKQVGIDPFGPVYKCYESIRRYDPILANVQEMGMKSVSIYTHRGAPEAVALGAKRGLDVKVYSVLKNQAGIPRDFVYDGLAPDDKSEFRIVDVIPNESGVSGQNTTVTEWNAAYSVLTKIKESGMREFAFFARLPSIKSGNDQYAYRFEEAKFIRDIRTFKNIAFTFGGVRAHNGEFLYWSSDRATDTKQITWIKLETDKDASMVTSWINMVVPARIALANDLRTWAVPCGVIMFDVGPRTFNVQGERDLEPVETISPVDISANALELRQHPSVRAIHAEAHVQSTAASFGDSVAVTLQAATDASSVLMRRNKAPK